MLTKYKLDESDTNQMCDIKQEKYTQDEYVFATNNVSIAQNAYLNYKHLRKTTMPEDLCFELASVKALLLSMHKIELDCFHEIVEEPITWSTYMPECKMPNKKSNVSAKACLIQKVAKQLRKDTGPARIHALKYQVTDPEEKAFLSKMDSDWILHYTRVAKLFWLQWRSIIESKRMCGYFYTPVTPDMARFNIEGDSLWAISFCVISPFLTLEECQKVEYENNTYGFGRHQMESLVDDLASLLRNPVNWSLAVIGQYPFLRPFRIQTKFLGKLLVRVGHKVAYEKACLLLISKMINNLSKKSYEIIFELGFDIPIK